MILRTIFVEVLDVIFYFFPWVYISLLLITLTPFPMDLITEVFLIFFYTKRVVLLKLFCIFCDSNNDVLVLKKIMDLNTSHTFVRYGCFS